MLYYNNKEFINALPKVLKKDFKGNSKGEYFYNHPVSFDIETSSFYSHDEKHEKTAIMYIWQFCIDDLVVIGRTWQEFQALMIRLTFMLGLDENHKMVIYVHNLSYEFQFIRKLFKWSKVFALEPRKVCYADTGPFEFRCSYLLSGYSLENLAKAYNLRDQKLHTLDYKKIRTPLTKMSDEEISYCVNDVLVVCDFIKMKIEQYNNVASIPLTSTGEVRKEARKKVLHSTGHNKLSKTGHRIQEKLQMNDRKEFETCRQAFQGGFTHANAFEVNAVNENISSYDFTSSYPYVMLSEQYPMSKGVRIVMPSNKEYEETNKRFLTIACLEIKNLKPIDITDNPISLSRVIKPSKVTTNNGRVVYMKHGYVVVTNIDFEIYKQFYNFGYKVIYMYRYRKEYLPKEYIELILEYYNKKTTLKGVQGKEIEYMHAKQKLNSLYGMMVTNPLRPEIVLEETWDVKEMDINEALDKYNHSKTRFTFYPWGVFVTAYARRNLFTGIKEFGRDYIYSDTDSLKVKHRERHLQYIEDYNRETQEKLKVMCQVHGIEYSVPKTVKGVPKPLGVWDFEGTYSHFKTLGAKRYLYDIDGELHITVSGIRKSNGQKYLSKFKDPYKVFCDGMEIPKEETGKNILTYMDTRKTGVIEDYQGNVYEYDQPTGIHMEETTCSIGLASDFIRYLQGIQNKIDL